jgi:proline iminopeptidase
VFKRYRLPWISLFSLAVSAALVGSAPAQNTPSPLAGYETQFETGKVSRERFDLYYRSLGTGEPILILSGGPGDDCDYLLPVASDVAKYAHAILLEQLGTGRSLLPRSTRAP